MPENAWQKRRRLSGWSGGYVEWLEDGVAFLSVVFTWMLPHALKRARYWRFFGYDVRVGGPAVVLKPGVFGEFATEGGSIPGVLQRHNPNATRATMGCPNRCKFCAAWRTEGKLQKLADDDWPVLPLECSNNLLAAGVEFFDHVINRYLDSPVVDIDFNQGLDARKLESHHAERLSELHHAEKLKRVRLAWDDWRLEKQFTDAHGLLTDAGIPANMISVYVLIGYKDTPEDALHRLQTIWSMGSWPNPMRYQPLDALKKNQYVDPNWTDYQLRKYVKYWSNLFRLSGIPFKEFRLIRNTAELSLQATSAESAQIEMNFGKDGGAE